MDGSHKKIRGRRERERERKKKDKEMHKLLELV